MSVKMEINLSTLYIIPQVPEKYKRKSEEILKKVIKRGTAQEKRFEKPKQCQQKEKLL